MFLVVTSLSLRLGKGQGAGTVLPCSSFFTHSMFGALITFFVVNAFPVTFGGF